MDRTERFYRIDQLMQDRGVVARDAFLVDLGVSPATFKRDLEYMRDRLNAPVVYDAEVRKRIRLLAFAPRKLPLEHFESIGRATLKRLRIHVTYYARSTDETSGRDVSPQRLVHYRGNWYLDGWCHLRNDLRTFAIDGIRSVSVLDEGAREVSVKSLGVRRRVTGSTPLMSSS